MKRILAIALLAIGLSARAPAAELIGDVTLKSGRVLHHAKLLSDQYESLVVFAAEGMVKVKKADLPPALLEKYPIRAAPPPPPAQLIIKPIAMDPPDKAAPAPEPLPPPAAAAVDPAMLKGCLITNYALKPLQATYGCVEVTIHNTSADPLDITPAMLRCTTTDGKAHPGVRFFLINDTGMMTMKKTERIEPSGDFKEVVFFQNDTLDIQSVTWAR